MWKEGSIRVNGEVFHYWMKQYDKGSEWGIDGGRISKLMFKRDGYIVCNYDRGWDIPHCSRMPCTPRKARTPKRWSRCRR